MTRPKKPLISRRSCLEAMALPWLISACASNSGSARPWQGSLAQVLSMLPSLRTGQQVIDKFGAPALRVPFDHDDNADKYYPNTFSLETRKRGQVAIPLDLVDKIPVGTPLLVYGFKYGSAMNPTGGGLTVCVNDTDEIVGWMYSKSLE